MIFFGPSCIWSIKIHLCIYSSLIVNAEGIIFFSLIHAFIFWHVLKPITKYISHLCVFSQSLTFSFFLCTLKHICLYLDIYKSRCEWINRLLCVECFHFVFCRNTSLINESSYSFLRVYLILFAKSLIVNGDENINFKLFNMLEKNIDQNILATSNRFISKEINPEV